MLRSNPNKMTSKKRKIGIYDFRSIPAGKFSIKTLTLINKSKEKQQYVITRDPKTNPLDYVFDVEPRPPVLNPGETCIVKLQYAPEVPFYANVDYFTITDSSGECVKIHTRGKALGPGVVSLENRLIFVSTPATPNVIKRVELRNESKMEAQYQIDIDSKQCVFKPDKTSGTIGPEKRIFVGITFSPPRTGVYKKCMIILIHYQHRVIIKLEGVSKPTPSDHKGKTVKLFDYSSNAKKDSIWESGFSPNTQSAPLVLSQTCLDFGCADVEQEEDRNKGESILVTNRSRDDFLLKWDEDKEDIFRIQPTSAIIPGGQFATFQATFWPKRKDLLFSIELEGRGFWHAGLNEDTAVKEGRDQLIAYLPETVAVRMLGNSFPAGGYGWMPQYRVCPTSITLPPCVPQVPVTATFLIERYGHLPISFTFIPPEVTQLKMHPMQGLIEGESQIVMVELTPDFTADKVYAESWTVQFNGTPSHKATVDFRGYAEYPVVVVGDENVVSIPSTYRGAGRTVSVPVKNMSRHCIRFRYESVGESNPIAIAPAEGTIAPNETATHKMRYLSESIGFQTMHVRLETVALDGSSSSPMGAPTHTDVTVHAQCEQLTLVAFPKHIDCNMTLLKQPLTKSFRLFNFGTCPVHFQLMWSRQSGERCPRAKDLELTPMSGTVAADSNLEILVAIHPSHLHFNQFVVSYHSTRDGHTYTDEPWRPVVQIIYEGMTPTMTIEDLKFKCAGPLITKVCLSRLMHIEELNEALRSGVPDTKAQVTVRFPEAPVGTHPITVYIYLKNNCFFTTEWKFQGQKNCSCQSVGKIFGQSKVVVGSNCPHRSLVTIHPKRGILEPKTRLVLEVAAKYELEGSWELPYILELPNNRQIFINFEIVAYPVSKSILSMYTPTLELSSVFVGDLYPATQMFWLYNNSHKDAKYFIDTLPLRKLMLDEYRVEVLKCLNPTGVVKAKSTHAIRFKFKPCEFKKYEVQLPINVGNTVMNYNLKVSGDGVVYFDSHVRFLHGRAPTQNDTDMSEVPVLFSSDNIVIKSFPTNSKAERIIFMKNQTDASYEYIWHKCILENVLRGMVNPARGILKPRETHMCRVTVESNSEPCITTARIHLELVNVYDKYEHEKSLMVYQAMVNQMEGEFIITKNGYSEPKTDMKIYPMPEPMDLAVAVACHIYNPTDPDVKFSLKEQLKQRPDERFCLNSESSTTSQAISQVYKNFIVASLEKTIWDTINSKWFERNLGELQKEQTPYYSQFRNNDKEQEKLRKETYSIAPHHLTADIINGLTYQLMQEIFDFGSLNKDTGNEQLKETPLYKEEGIFEELQPMSIPRIKTPFGW